MVTITTTPPTPPQPAAASAATTPLNSGEPLGAGSPALLRLPSPPLLIAATTPTNTANNAAAPVYRRGAGGFTCTEEAGQGVGVGVGPGVEVATEGAPPGSLPVAGLTFEGVLSPSQVL